MPNNTVFADALTDDQAFSVSVDFSLNIVLSNNNLELPILPHENGQFGRSSTNVYVDTNNAAGYTLTLQSNTDKLINKQANSSIPTITSPSTPCTDESNDTCDTFPLNQWGYRIGDTGSYLPATGIVNNPIRLAQTDTVTMTTDPAATLYFGAKINTDKPTGIYDGVELTFIATANIQKYNVTLLPTTGISSIQLDNNEPCTNTTSGCVYALEKDSQHTLTANVASNHKFTGWANSTAYGSFSDITTPTTTFTVGEGDATVTANGEANGLNEMTSCDLASGATATLTDTRDGQSYKIGKLADGKCWMLENLRLTPGTSGRTLKPSDSNVKQDRIWNPSSSTSYNESTMYYYQPTDTAKIYNGTDTSSAWKNVTDAKTMGILYNYAAATVGTITGGSNSTEATEDICPAGWHLPKQSEYSVLYAAYSSNWMKFDNAFKTVLAGHFSDWLYDVGSGGYFWSSTANGINGRYYLYANTGDINSSNSVWRGVGYSIRCVFGS